MTTTEVPTDNSDAVEAMRRLLTDAPILEHTADMLMFGAQHGMVDPATVPPLEDWDSIQRLREDGLERAWDADQARRGVPIVCPDWCTISHLDPRAHTRRLLGPWEGVVAHGTQLAVGDKISVDYSEDQVHPDNGRAAREYVSIWTSGDGPIELAPTDLAVAVDDFGSTLQRALDRLAEIRTTHHQIPQQQVNSLTGNRFQ